MSLGTPTRQVVLDGVPVATLIGEAPRMAEPLQRDRDLVMSRFAWVRREGGRLLAETSLGPCAVVLEDPRVHRLALAFAAPRSADAAVADEPGLPAEIVFEIASIMHAASLLIDARQAALEDEPPLAVWEFHDLLFHSRTRTGRNRNSSGGTYRFLDRFAPPPALPPDRWPETVALERPEYERLERDDPPLARVQSSRTSVRHYDERPLTIDQLGGLLYRVGRVEDYWEMPIPGPGAMSFVAKPYPSGGALYELELYAAVQACEGIEPGLYHYQAAAHRLARVSGSSGELDALIAGGAAGMGVAAASLQVLIVVTARFERIAWKYQSIAYELVLKHVGVVLESMYLVATAIELAPCAIGTGNSDLFARASGIDYYTETAVGELALGSRAMPSTVRG